MVYLSEDQSVALRQYEGNILPMCLKELEALDWAFSKRGSKLTKYDIDRSFQFYSKLGEERKRGKK